MRTTQELSLLLGLNDPEQLFSRTPEGGDGAVIRKVFEVLEDAAKEIGLDGSNRELGIRHRVISAAGHVLFKQQAYQSVLYLANIAEYAKTPTMVHFRLLAHLRRGAVEAVIHEASEILGATDSSPALRELVRNFLRLNNIERNICPKVEHFADFVPDIEATKNNPFLCPPLNGPFPMVSLIWPTIARLNGIESEDQEFQDRIRWGSAVQRQILFLRRLCGVLNAKPLGLRTVQEKTAFEVLAALNSALVPPEREPLLKDIEGGRSIVLVHAHAGMSGVSNMGLPLGNTPQSMVARAAAKAHREQDFNLKTLGPNVALEFAKLVKAMKKEPRIVQIFPDGGDGETSIVSVCGRDVQIGRGAALLAHAAKASVYFCGSHWTGQKFDLCLTRGPNGDEYSSKLAFEAEFLEFYGSCLEAIVLGPPEDMAPDGGFWKFFR